MMTAKVLKRFLASIYELLILMAIWMLSTWLYIRAIGPADSGVSKLGLQVWLWVITGAYFVRCWAKSGQTPATQAWKLQLVNADGSLLTTQQATLRYILASVFIVLFGVGLLWAFFDRDHLLLHDRLLGTRWAFKT